MEFRRVLFRSQATRGHRPRGDLRLHVRATSQILRQPRREAQAVVRFHRPAFGIRSFLRALAPVVSCLVFIISTVRTPLKPAPVSGRQSFYPMQREAPTRRRKSFLKPLAFLPGILAIADRPVLLKPEERGFHERRWLRVGCLYRGG